MSPSISKKIVVLGSINMDLVVRCDRLPKPGETITASAFGEFCGGKGANQAVAAARSGGRVSMIGRVGDDVYADVLRANLVREQIDCEHVLPTANCPSGIAIVSVELSGENSIVVVPGANGAVCIGDLTPSFEAIRNADVLLLQLEIPVDVAIAAISFAKRSSVRVILNPAPYPPEWSVGLLAVNLLCPNQREAECMVDFKLDSIEAAKRAALEIRRRGAPAVVITLGSRGSVVSVGERTDWIAPYKVDAIDTTAAGDAFVGALAVRWSETDDLFEAIRFASAAGALAASKVGAQPSLPNRDKILQLFHS